MSLVKLCGIKNLSDVFVCLKEKDEDNGVLFFISAKMKKMF